MSLTFVVSQGPAHTYYHMLNFYLIECVNNENIYISDVASYMTITVLIIICPFCLGVSTRIFKKIYWGKYLVMLINWCFNLHVAYSNGSQLAKMKKSIPDMSLP